MKIYQHDAGHMNKMAVMCIYMYGKKPFKNILWNQWADFNEIFYEASGNQVHHSLFK